MDTLNVFWVINRILGRKVLRSQSRLGCVDERRS